MSLKCGNIDCVCFDRNRVKDNCTNEGISNVATCSEYKPLGEKRKYRKPTEHLKVAMYLTREDSTGRLFLTDRLPGDLFAHIDKICLGQRERLNIPFGKSKRVKVEISFPEKGK